jgi:hypothetical protein
MLRHLQASSLILYEIDSKIFLRPWRYVDGLLLLLLMCIELILFIVQAETGSFAEIREKYHSKDRERASRDRDRDKSSISNSNINLNNSSIVSNNNSNSVRKQQRTKSIHQASNLSGT